MSAHTCRESENPRHKGYCACGKRMGPATPKLLRILALEREFTEEACRGVTNPIGLITHAETRCQALSAEYVEDPLEIRRGLDRLLEAREELADARNHLVFDMQEHLGDEERLNELLYIVQGIAILYNRLAKL